MFSFDFAQKFGRDGLDAMTRSASAMSAGAQSATSETVEYAKRSFEQGRAATDRLLGARTVEAAMQVQGDFLRSSYEGLVAQAGRMGELAVNTARDAYSPVEGLFAKSTSAA